MDELPSMDELPLKVVKMHGAKDEVIVRVNNFLIAKAGFEKALFVYPDAQETLEDYFEVERRVPLLAPRLRRPPGNAAGGRLLWGVLVTALIASEGSPCRYR